MKKLLLVFAHPDDESYACGGTIPKYIKAGWEVDVLCATRGEAGGDGEVRQKELEKAGTLLGIHSSGIDFFFLRYKATLSGIHA